MGNRWGHGYFSMNRPKMSTIVLDIWTESPKYTGLGCAHCIYFFYFFHKTSQFYFLISLTYQCPVGAMPIGEENQTCGKDGKWSGFPIGCKQVECGQVPGLADGEIHVLDGRTNYGARVRYKCKTDYSLIGGE